MENTDKIKDVTNLLFIKGHTVLLGQKKRGFGKGKFNGFGGKLEPGESIEQAAIREAIEESGLTPLVYEKRAIIDFPNSYPFRMNLYVCTKWDGEPQESEEMRPEWFDFDQVPYEKMWEDDRYWLKFILEGKKIRASFTFENNEDLTGTAQNKITNHHLEIVDSLD